MKLKFRDPSSQNLLEIISTSANRGADMVRQVLSFARGVEGRRIDVRISDLLQEIGKIANDTFLKSIMVNLTIPTDLWAVTGDPTQLHQVLLNLCVNARDSMPVGGTLSLAAENVNFDVHDAGLHPGSTPGRYVIVEVRDTGTGIAPDVLEKIFDPFFTTKEIGKGTGLGLSTTQAIVKNHGGFIEVSSEIGIGTAFRIYLPVSAGVSGRVARVVPELPRGHGELILIVDDETTVRQITRQTLEVFGYSVLLATDGSDAGTVYAARHQEIAIVLTDMMMPVMDGVATIQSLKRINPAVRIIAASGGHAGEVSHLGVRHFLQKPYTAETLLKALAEVLAAE
jgi:CheY-like chemotaxis protein